MAKIVALLTDFGTTDIYVGVMKAVMLGIDPALTFVDITHAIPPQSVRAGALALANSYTYFPGGTVFLIVVDPGVGSARRPIAVAAGDYTFVAPDNGVLSAVLATFDHHEAVLLRNGAYQLPHVSHSFHGRDIFAPAAAHLASGVPLSKFGERVTNLVHLPSTEPQFRPGTITGEVTHIDHFGNIITNIGRFRWQGAAYLSLNNGDEQVIQLQASAITIQIAGQSIKGIAAVYAAVAPGNLLAQIDSNGYLEIAINQGDAARHLEVRIGDGVDLQHSLAT